jgi:glyoxylase I family protein
MYTISDTRIFFSPCDQARVLPHDKEAVGLNHLAFGVNSLEDLQVIQKQLEDARTANSGIQIDKYGQKEFIWLDDPDKMRSEFYVRPAG